MYNLENIRSVHFEVTSKCQARCPMCPRRINGGLLNPLIDLHEVTLEQFKQWFSVDFIKQLYYLNMCGNLGDPIVAKDTLEIYQYLRECNKNMTLVMHTNGSAKNVKWWEDLAQLNVSVTFGIDGLADTHHLYRISTDWDKIIENAKAFISAGGKANWEMLVFKHNEHQVEDCKKLSQDLGFLSFAEKHTSRFQDNKFHALDDEGRTTHILYPTSRSLEMLPKIQQSIIEIKPYIDCKSVRDLQIYVSANGNVSPCCWLDFSWILPKQDSRIEYMDRIDMLPNLHKQSLEDIFESRYFDKISNTWKNEPLKECARQCGKFDKLKEQYVNRY
jgi:MoaA/NifB/PqqE/SkfB family radical SAM enzyme